MPAGYAPLHRRHWCWLPSGGDTSGICKARLPWLQLRGRPGVGRRCVPAATAGSGNSMITARCSTRCTGGRLSPHQRLHEEVKMARSARIPALIENRSPTLRP
jgi:hypothetical protein